MIVPLFILIAIGVYSLGNYYIALRGWQALPQGSWLRPAFTVLFAVLSLQFILSKFLEHSSAYTLLKVSYYTGSYWMAASLYFFIAVLAIDAVRLVNLGFHFLPDVHSVAYQQIKLIAFGVVILFVGIILGYGRWTALHPRLKNVPITIEKQAGDRKALKIAMVSDIHLGTLFGKSKVAHMVQRINDLHPDIIVLCGDILDEVQSPIFRKDIGASLKDLKAPLGVYAITGNHEYIGGVKSAVKYLESKNITLLKDTCILIDNSFYLAGREDKDGLRFGYSRKPLSDILRNADKSRPVILLDHQPYKLSQAVDNGVDLQLSGHTHNGQFWPFNLVVNRVWELSWGYWTKLNTHFYVSSGYGTWGPPVRNSGHPEWVCLDLKFK
jgi:predicted MPP superfamily phosphohydrolase